MKHIYIILFSCIFSVSGLFAQDFPLHTQYMYNKGAINPGFIGVKGKMSFLLMHRSQWVNVDGAPMSTNLAYEYPFERAAFGLAIDYDQIGPLTQYTGNLQFSYNIELSYTTFLSLGINAGAYNKELNIDKLNVYDPTEEIFSENINNLDFNVGFGAFLYSETWYFGISTPNLNLQKQYKQLYLYDKHLLQAYVMGGYNFEINRDMTLQPSFLVRYVDQLPISADFSLNLQWNESLTTGLAYRLNAAYSLLVGFNVTRQLHIGYAFDWDQNPIYKVNYGSHEFFIRYYLTRDENSLRYQSPRFF
jgi:type IX secretion system PorP/SprF family membrane protein